MVNQSTPRDFYDELVAASLEDPKAFAERFLLLAKMNLDLVAGAFYLYTPKTQILRLKAQVGLPAHEYRMFELPRDSLPGRAIHQDEVVFEEATPRSSFIRDNAFLESIEKGGVVAAPLSLAGVPFQTAQGMIETPDQVGAICLYFHDLEMLPTLREWATSYGPFLARLYLAALERYTMYFRSATVARAAFRTDTRSLAYAFLELARAELEVRSGALWIYDHRQSHLYLSRSVGKYANVRDQEVHPVPLLDSNAVSTCFNKQTVIRHSTQNPYLIESNLPKDISLPDANAALYPVPLPADARLGGKPANGVGVLVLYDHHTTIGQLNQLTDFGWEDSSLAKFCCEMLSVLLFQTLRTVDHESDFERRMHGASTALQAARSNLQFIKAHFSLSEMLPTAQQHYIPNAVEWLEDLEAQITRNDLVGANLQPKPTLLYGEVLAKIAPMVKRMAKQYGTGDFTVLGLDELEETYRQLPQVLGDRRALDRVFRNLVENSLKYQSNDPAVNNKLVVKAYARGVTVIVIFADNGLGIPPDDVPFVFEDGFRGRDATGRRPQGIGRGLFECKTILDKLGGAITVTDSDEVSGAAFRIELRTVRGAKGSSVRHR